MKPDARRWSGLAPLAVALAWLAFSIGLRALAVPDEGRYVGIAWGMLTSGHWLVPQLDGLPYFHKPPLFYWITAASLALFGHHEGAARVAPLFGAALGTTALYLFARRWWSESAARLTLVALVTQPLVFVGAQFANLDMLVAGCIAATICAFAHAALLLAAGRDARAFIAAGYLFTALGVLAKGLVGIVLPGLVLVAWLLLQRRPRLIVSLLWWPGILLFLAVAGPWFVLMQRAFPAFSHYFFYVQHFARYAEGGFNNQQPWYFYLVVLGGLALPWSAWLVASALRRGDAAPDDPLRRGLRQLPWLWLVLVTLFFSLPQSKLVGYILPAAWPVALIAADGRARFAPGARRLKLWRASLALAVAGCLAGLAWGTAKPLHSLQPIGEVLARLAAPGDRIVFIGGYYFDLPFYARLQAPAIVVDQWDDARLTAVDSWRKELADAGRFAPQRAQDILVLPKDVPARFCQGPRTWFVGAESADAQLPFLDQARVVFAHRQMKIWRLDPPVPGIRRPGCPGTPSENPAGTS